LSEKALPADGEPICADVRNDAVTKALAGESRLLALAVREAADA
jgi:hypothetical protein